MRLHSYRMNETTYTYIVSCKVSQRQGTLQSGSERSEQVRSNTNKRIYVCYAVLVQLCMILSHVVLYLCDQNTTFCRSSTKLISSCSCVVLEVHPEKADIISHEISCHSPDQSQIQRSNSIGPNSNYSNYDWSWRFQWREFEFHFSNQRWNLGGPLRPVASWRWTWIKCMRCTLCEVTLR